MTDASEFGKSVGWTSRLELYFANTGEKAHALSWLHKRSQARYSQFKNVIALPVVILGTLNGSISIGSSSLFGDSPYASVAVGVVALLTAILSTIGSFFKWEARAESHRIAALQYAKLYRFLAVQMSLPREERLSPSDLLKYTKDGYDRLEEIAQLIPSEVVAEFRRRFDKPEYKEISRPEDCNGLEAIEIYTTHELMSPERHNSAKKPVLTVRDEPHSGAVAVSSAVGAFPPSASTGVREPPSDTNTVNANIVPA